MLSHSEKNQAKSWARRALVDAEEACGEKIWAEMSPFMKSSFASKIMCHQILQDFGVTLGLATAERIVYAVEVMRLAEDDPGYLETETVDALVA